MRKIFNSWQKPARAQSGQGMENEFQGELPSLPAWGMGPKAVTQRTTSPPAESEPEGEADPSIDGHAQPRSFTKPFNSSFAGSAVTSFEPRSFDVCSVKTASFEESYFTRVDPLARESPLDPAASASPMYVPSGDVPPSPAIDAILPPQADMPSAAEAAGLAVGSGTGFSSGGALAPLWQEADDSHSNNAALAKALAAEARLREAQGAVEAAQADYEKARLALKEGGVENTATDSAPAPNGPYAMSANMPVVQPGLWQGAIPWGMPVWYQSSEAWPNQYAGAYSGYAFGELLSADPDLEDPDAAGEKKSKKKASKAKKQSPGAHAANIAATVKEEERTTLMLRNIPNNYTRQMLLDLLDEVGLVGQYDFVYLPMDFKSFAGLGYAFVNLVSHESAVKAKDILHGFTSWKAASEKVCSVAWGDPLQGYESHVERYRNSPVMHPDVPEKFKPAAFKDGVKIDFPPPTKKIAAPRCKRTNPEPASA